MRPTHRFVCVLMLALSGSAGPAFAISLSQHGGRATAQAGAFTARASDPSAVRYNPAALARLDGWEFQAGLDFSAPRDDYDSRSGGHAAEHFIGFAPALYLSWTQRSEERYPIAFGLGLDSPLWMVQNWNTAGFPPRFLGRRTELTLFEIRPAVAVALDERWSVGGAVRYLRGDFELGWSQRALIGDPLSLPVLPVEVDTLAAASVDGFGYELAAHFAERRWGAGVVLSSAVELAGAGSASFLAVDPPTRSDVQAFLARNLAERAVDQRFELPAELRLGGWFAATDDLRVELDLAWILGSTASDSEVDFPVDSSPLATDRTVRRDWKDVLAVRLGAELDLAGGWAVGAGLALEPSPVPEARVEPGFPRGDARVVSLGASYNLPNLSFDLGYSFHSFEDREVGGQELDPTVRGTYSSRSQVFAVSARWRFE